MLYLFLLVPALLIGYGITELSDDDDDGSTSDLIRGDERDNDLDGLAGNDTILGGEGDDNIEGGTGADSLRGNAGNDVIEGEQNDDTITGEGGDDFIQGGRGDDLVTGGADDDWIEGNGGNDTLDADQGDDTVIGGSGADEMVGGSGDDILISGNVAGTPLRFEDLKSLRDGADLAGLLGVDDSAPLDITDDGAADTLLGGVGDDLLILGAGDEGNGNGGTDSFVVMEDQQGDAGPATITNLQADETVAILARDDGTDPEITVQTDGDDALVLADGVILARVTGAGSTLTADDVTLFDVPTVGDIDPT